MINGKITVRRRIATAVLALLVTVMCIPAGIIVTGVSGVPVDADAFSRELSSLVEKYSGSDYSPDAERDEAGEKFYSARLIAYSDGADLSRSEGVVDSVSGPDNVYILQYNDESSAQQAYEKLSSDGSVISVEPDLLMSATDEDCSTEAPTGAYGGDAVKASSEYVGNSWGCSVLEVGAVNSYFSGIITGSITVAVIDSGVSEHSLLDGRLLSGGYDYVSSDSDPTDENGHGTHVAGTIVDLTRNLNVNILAYRVLDSEGYGYSSDIGAAITAAVSAGCRVVNLSLGGEGISEYYKTVIKNAIKAGTTVCISAGNESMDTARCSPAYLQLEGAIVVSSISETLAFSSFSNFGESVDMCAPGEYIKSCYLNSGYAYMSGTSMSCPHIAACAAMVMLITEKTPAQTEAYLESLCVDLGEAGHDPYYGYGYPVMSGLSDDYCAIESIDFAQSGVTVEVGCEVTPEVTVSPVSATVNALEWSSSDESVAKVSGSGVITGVSVGTAAITASANNGAVTASCVVTVTEHVHSYTVGEAVEPTCTEEGYTPHTCRCGDSYRSDIIPANGHSFINLWHESKLTHYCSVCEYTEQVPAPVIEPSLLTVYSETDPRILVSGARTTTAKRGSNWQGGTSVLYNGLDTTVKFAFTGTGCVFYSYGSSTQAELLVTMDSGASEYVSLFSSETQYQYAAWSASGLDDGYHIVEIVIVGSQSGMYNFHLDGIGVCGTLEDVVEPEAQYTNYQPDNSKIYKTGTWTNKSSSSWEAGFAQATTTNGQTVVFTFDGRAFALMGYMSPTQYGQVRIKVDGGEEIRVSVNASTAKYKQVIFESGPLSRGEHTVVVTFTRGSMTLDAVMTDGTLKQPVVSDELIFTSYEATDSRIVYTGNSTPANNYYLTNHSGMKLNSKYADMYFTYEGDDFLIRGVLVNGSVMEVSIDGGDFQQVDCGGSMTFGLIICGTEGMTDGVHNVHIRFTDFGYIDDILVNGALVAADTSGVDLWKNYEPVAEQSRLILTGSLSWKAKSTGAFDGRSALGTRSADATMTFAFTGTKFEIIGYTSSTQGNMYVSIDGAAPVTVNLRSDSSAYRVRTYTSDELAAGAHTVTLSFSATNASVDTLRIVGTLTDANLS